MPLIDRQPDALAYTYARSLFELADAAGGAAAVEDVQGELEDLLELARQNASFSEFLASRVLAAGKRAASLDRILSGRVSDLTRRFLIVLNEKDRLSHLPAIAAAYDALVQEKLGRVEVDVFTAEPIAPDALRGLRDRLADALKKEVVAHPYTDASMIGGVKFRIGDQLVDASLATRLRKMRDQFGESGAASLRARMGRIIEP